MLTKNKFLDAKELAYLLRLCTKYPGRDSLLIKFLLFTGARGVEALNVRKKDISDKAVTIYAAKGSNDRTIPLPDHFFSELSKYIESMDDDERLFPITTRTLRFIWGRWRINPEKGIHAIRHTCAVEIYKKTRDVMFVKELLGHKSINSSMVYMSFVESQERLRSVVNEIYTDPQPVNS